MKAAPVTLAGADDPRADPFRALADARALAAAGLFAAEGRLVLERLLHGAARFRLRAILATPALLAALGPRLDGARERPALFAASEPLIAEVVGHALHRGGVGLGERGPALDAAGVAEAAHAAGRPLLVLENVADPDNVGALFRNAAAFGAGGVLLSPGGGDPLYRKAVRASMGAVLEVPFARLAPWPEALAGLAGAGYRLVALAPRAPLALADLDPRPPTALLVGNEGGGLSAAALAVAPLAARIPIASGVDSLNVATAAAIALHHLRSGTPCGS